MISQVPVRLRTFGDTLFKPPCGGAYVLRHVDGLFFFQQFFNNSRIGQRGGIS
ncbi:hypothetical protein XETH111194_05850 [Xenorhabdus thuongxuanensis]